MKKITKLFLLMMLFAFSSAFVFGQSKTTVKQSFEQSGLSKDKFAAQFDRAEDFTFTHANKAFVPTRDATLSEGFETWPPTGWTIESPTGDNWEQGDGTYYGPGAAYEGSSAAMYDNWNISSGDEGSMTTPAFDVSGLDNPVVSFYWWNNGSATTPATIEVLTSTDGTNFTSVDVIDAVLSGATSWVEYNHAIGNDVTHVKLTAVSDWGVKNTFVDAFEIKELNLSPVLAVNYTGWNAGLMENNSTETTDVFAAFNGNIGDLVVSTATLTGSSAFTTTFDVAEANAALATPPAQATFSISLFDSYGDGWNGASLDVIVDGTVVLDDITIASGTQADFTFMVDNGSEVETIFTDGSWNSECTYTIYDNAGNNVIDDGPSPDGVTFTAATFPAYAFGFTFVPTTAGEHTATLTIESNGGTQVIDLVGNSYLEGSLVESFETAVPPNGWEANILSGDYNWAKADVPAVGDNSAFFDAWNAPDGSSAELISPQMDLTSRADNMLYFYYAHPTTTDSYTDMLEVYVSEDNGETWELLDEIMMQDLNWHLMSYDLSAYSGDEFKVKFVGISAYGQSIYVDQFVGPKLVNGNLTGYVYDLYTGDPIEGATVTLGSQSDMSNSFGQYAIEQIPIGTYTVSCEFPGYNTITEEIVITSDNVTTHDFNMDREALFSVNVDDYSVTLEPYQSVAKTFTISNDAEVGAANLDYEVSLDFIESTRSLGTSVPNGNPPTAANSEFGPVGEAPFINPNAPRDAWDILGSFNASSGAQAGIETDGEYIYTANWQTADFFKYTMDGTLVESFTIAGVSNVRDMAFDGEYFYGSAASTSLFKMDLANQTLVSTISVSCSGITGVRHIAYDPELDGGNGGFWVGNWSELGAIDMDGNELIANLSGISSSVYGSAYDEVSEGGPYLWLFAQPNSDAIFQQFDIAAQTLTGVTHDCSDAPGFSAGISGGAATFVADGKLIILGSIQQDPNLIVGYELAPYVTENWLTVLDGASGSIAPGESANVDIFFDAAGLVDVTKNANIVITHNGVVTSKEMESTIPAEMIVTPFVHDLSIFDIQFTTDPEGDSPMVDSTVRTTGVITAGDGGNTYFLQDMEETGSWNGIMIFTYDMDFEIGDKVTVVGKVKEYYGLTEITDIITELTTIDSHDNTLPDPLVVSTGNFGEQFEGVLLAVENAECVTEVNSYGESSVNDGTGAAVIDDVYYDFEPTLGNMYNVVGPLTYSYSEFKMLPRGEGDVEDITNEVPIAPFNLTADVQYRDVVLSWGQPQQPGWVTYYPGPQYYISGNAERGTYFMASDFGWEYPVEISGIRHGFYDNGSWDNDTFIIKIYDADGSTLLFESEEITALPQWQTTEYDLGTTLTLTDNFMVAIVPLVESGAPFSLANGTSTNGYSGGPVDGWYLSYEWSTEVFMSPVRGKGEITTEPTPFVANNSKVNLDNYVELEDSEIPFASGRYLKTYNLYRNGSLLVDGITDETYTDADLDDGVYSYYVTAVWTVGESSASNVVSVQMFYGTLEGQVVDAEYGVPIPDATITSTDGVYETTSDADGNFVFDEVEYGTHDFDVTADGYYGDTFMGIEIVQNETTTVEFALDREFPAPLNVAVDPYNAIISWNSPFGLTYDDDFEAYTVGGYLAEQSIWTTWDGTEGGATDALISDEQAQSGTKSVKIHDYQETDLVLEFGNRTSGVWEVNLSLYFDAEGDGGYYNLLHDFNGGNAEYAYEFTFDQLGAATFVAGGETIDVTYNAGEWNTFKTIIDLDSDMAELYVNGTMTHSWQWSLTSQGAAGLNQLGAMDVFAASLGDANPFFYMDDVSYGVLQGKEVVDTEEAPQFLYYNVYLDDYKLLETNNSSYQYTGLDLNSDYVGSASAVYSYMGDLHESEIIDVPFTFLPTEILAPINLEATVSNFNDIALTWEYPDRRYVESTLIFRNDVQIAEIDGAATSYNEVIGAGIHEYYVKAKYTGFHISDASNKAEAEVILPAPRNLTGESEASTVVLEWETPQIIIGDEFTEGFEAGFPPTGWSVVQTNSIETWEQVGTVSFTSGDVVPHEGEKQLECYWDFGDQDEWIITPEFTADATTSLTFWTYVTNGSTNGDHYYLKVSNDGGATWDIKWDASAEPAGDNHYDYAVDIDLSEYEGESIKVAWQGYAIGGLWYAWFIDDVTVAMADGVYSFNGSTLIQQPPVVGVITEQAQLSRNGDATVTVGNNRAFTTYNVYRNDELVGSSDQNYFVDAVYIDDIYEYYVTADYDGFESEASNTVLIDVITGINELDANMISLYPNPAKSLVNISSTQELTRISVTNYVGQVVYQSDLNAETSVKLNTSSYENGIYIVRLESENGVVTKRVIIAQ